MDGNQDIQTPAELIESFKSASERRASHSKEHSKLEEGQKVHLKDIDAEYSRAVSEAHRLAELKREAVKEHFGEKIRAVYAEIEAETVPIRAFREMMPAIALIGNTAKKLSKEKLRSRGDKSVLFYEPVFEHPAITLYGVIVANDRPVNNKSLIIIGEGIKVPRYYYCGISYRDNDARGEPQFQWAVKHSSSIKELERYFNKHILCDGQRPSIPEIAEFIDINMKFYEQQEQYQAAGYTLEAFKEAFATWCPHCKSYSFDNQDYKYKSGDLCRACKVGHVGCH